MNTTNTVTNRCSLTTMEMIEMAQEYISGQDEINHGTYDPRWVTFMRKVLGMLAEEQDGNHPRI